MLLMVETQGGMRVEGLRKKKNKNGLKQCLRGMGKAKTKLNPGGKRKERRSKVQGK